MSNPLLDQVRAAQSKLKDQTKEPENTGTFEIAAAGRAFARFVSYVEIGKRPQRPYQGKAKPDAHEVRLGFELVGKKHAREIDGPEGKKIVYPIIHVKTTVKGGEKATFTKLLKKMAYGRDGITHMALMLGEGFIVTVVHNTVGEGKDAKTYANIRDSEGNWLVAAPMLLKDANDPECDEWVPANVPPATATTQLLLWDAPTKEQWDSIFIDGTRDVKDDKGNVTQVSRNWMQEDITKSARDFEGSALHALLLELASGLELDGGKAAVEAAQGGDDLAGDLPTAPAEKPAPAPAVAPAEGDPLAALGFSDL